MPPQIPMQGGPEQMQQPPMQPMVEQPLTPTPVDEGIDALIQSHNIAESLHKTEKGRKLLEDIGKTVKEEFDRDKESRKTWEDQNEQYLKLACQVMETKNYPWKNASNIKFPVLTTAALQFSSRAYPALVNGFDVVKAKAVGSDPEGQAQAVAQDISTHMSYQLLHEMPGWDEDMDKLCFILPILGTCFKKTYYSPDKGTNCSELVLPKDLVVNYWTKDLESAARVTHVLYRTCNQITERQRQGVYLDHDKVRFEQGSAYIESGKKDNTSLLRPPSKDRSTPRILLEQHTFWDMDDDGYEEPYVITIDYDTGEVLRIVARFYEDGVELDDKGKIAYIKPCSHFTKFGFIPNPDGGFYDLGFGLLLGGINESVNTLINQLVDAGTLSNLQAGFISKGIRIGQGELKLGPGEWKAVNNFGDDLKKGIFPLPVKEPSNVLFQLLGTLVQSGKELASIAEIFTGKMPGQNTPASTTMATIEQGLKVFTAIYKRIYRAMGEEFEKLYQLNRIYMPDTVNFSIEVAGSPEKKEIKRESYARYGTTPQANKPFIRIIPAADPNMVSETQRLIKAQGLLELIQLGTVNPSEATKQILEQQGQANIKQLMTMPPPPTPPEVLKIQSQEKIEMAKLQLEQMKLMSENQKRQSEIALNIAKAKELGDQEGLAQLELQIKREEAQLDMMMKMMELKLKREEHMMDMEFKNEEHNMDMQVKQTEAALNMDMKARLNEQNIQANKQKNEAQIDMMKKKDAIKPKGKESK